MAAQERIVNFAPDKFRVVQVSGHRLQIHLGQGIKLFFTSLVDTKFKEKIEINRQFKI
ncbi:hypothetical protein PI95_023205 [Hassallia byssoidea VB512170]|uniref:Uncharacterized protein n=1 Tax=Hassallia byssoidea VB512170 TaxID=1304833 RepID=A0A846HFH8_9CYAN|nr:hypothetical protein [Hassalia byssoidea]NEU75384.1 hypothetical protein [Hassalia byssoidea VB512170]